MNKISSIRKLSLFALVFIMMVTVSASNLTLDKNDTILNDTTVGNLTINMTLNNITNETIPPTNVSSLNKSVNDSLLNTTNTTTLIKKTLTLPEEKVLGDLNTNIKSLTKFEETEIKYKFIKEAEKKSLTISNVNLKPTDKYKGIDNKHMIVTADCKECDSGTVTILMSVNQYNKIYGVK